MAACGYFDEDARVAVLSLRPWHNNASGAYVRTAIQVDFHSHHSEQIKLRTFVKCSAVKDFFFVLSTR
jgi:hypothetical protein